MTEKFGISREEHSKKMKKLKAGPVPVNEVEGLKDIFLTFFNSHNKLQSQKKNVLVDMTTPETSINPFHVPEDDRSSRMLFG